MTPEAKAIAAKLTDFGYDWRAGPDLPDEAIRAIPELRRAGLIERAFLDEAPAKISLRDGAIAVGLRACWHFRLTDAARALLKHQPHDHP